MDRQLQVEQFRVQGVLFCSSEVFFVIVVFSSHNDYTVIPIPCRTHDHDFRRHQELVDVVLM